MLARDRPSCGESSPLLPPGEESETSTSSFRGNGLVKLVRVISVVVVVVVVVVVASLAVVASTASTASTATFQGMPPVFAADAAVVEKGVEGVDGGVDEYVLYALSNEEGLNAQILHLSTQLEIARRDGGGGGGG